MPNDRNNPYNALVITKDSVPPNNLTDGPRKIPLNIAVKAERNDKHSPRSSSCMPKDPFKMRGKVVLFMEKANPDTNFVNNRNCTDDNMVKVWRERDGEFDSFLATFDSPVLVLPVFEGLILMNKDNTMETKDPRTASLAPK